MTSVEDGSASPSSPPSNAFSTSGCPRADVGPSMSVVDMYPYFHRDLSALSPTTPSPTSPYVPGTTRRFPSFPPPASSSSSPHRPRLLRMGVDAHGGPIPIATDPSVSPPLPSPPRPKRDRAPPAPAPTPLSRRVRRGWRISPRRRPPTRWRPSPS